MSEEQPKATQSPQDGLVCAEASMTMSARYGEALHWAEELHRGQLRKGKQVPYISHLISVSALVWEDGGTEKQAIAALLHDAIEDAGQGHGFIAERLREAVGDTVGDCTDTCDFAPAQDKALSCTKPAI